MNKRAYPYLLIVVFIMMAICMVGCESTKPDDTTTVHNYDIICTIINNTEDVVLSGSVKRPGSADSSLLSLFDQPLEVGGYVEATINSRVTDSQGRVYIRLTTAEGVQYTKRLLSIMTHMVNGVLIPFSGIVTFTKDDIDADSPRIITITNNSGSAVTSINTRWPGSTVSWVNIPFASEVPNAGSGTLIIQKTNMNNQFHIDIQLCTAFEAISTKLDEQIIHKGNYTFASSELDTKVSITNSTSDYIVSAWAKRPDSTIWTCLFNEIAVGVTETVNIPSPVIDADHAADIQLRTARGVLFSKNNTTINENGTMAFTAEDIDRNSPLQVRIVNNTDITINTAQVRLPGSNSYVSVIAGGDSLLTNGERDIIIPRESMDTQSRSEIILRNRLGITYTKPLLLITHRANVNFSPADIATTSPLPVNIVNETGANIISGYIKHPNSDSTTVWLPLFTTPATSPLVSGGQLLVAIPLSAMDGNRTTDIQLRSSASLFFAKHHQEIAHNATVTFESGDRDYVGTNSEGQGGGIIFYDKGNYEEGWRFLEVATVDREFTASWGLLDYYCSGTDTYVGAGLANTNAIVNYLNERGETGKAAQLCDSLNLGGLTDWFLPSKDELNFMYINLAMNDIGNFKKTGDWPADYYWSSSAEGLSTWCQGFSGGVQYLSEGSAYRTFGLSVRAVRRY